MHRPHVPGSRSRAPLRQALMGFRLRFAQAIGSNGAFRCFFEEQKVCSGMHVFAG